mmetsp:Transcript_11511/g.28352  ORF Transcript_11511/g.28352 Transcript_11511/m.28352 type:complete len:108 (-) Transcript_11511:138-461(-)
MLDEEDFKEIAELDGGGPAGQGTSRIEATFRNEMDQHVGLFWISHAGDEVEQGKLFPWDDLVVHTYPNHIFEARLDDGTIVSRHKIKFGKMEQIHRIKMRRKSKDDL